MKTLGNTILALAGGAVRARAGHVGWFTVPVHRFAMKNPTRSGSRPEEFTIR